MALNPSCASQTAKHKPVPLDLAAIEGSDQQATVASASQLPDQRVMSVAEVAALFLSTIRDFYASAERRGTLGAAAVSTIHPPVLPPALPIPPHTVPVRRSLTRTTPWRWTL